MKTALVYRNISSQAGLTSFMKGSTMGKPMLSELVRGAITNRKPFSGDDDPWLIGYRTKGGTYMLATTGRQDDDARSHDLIAITGMTAVIAVRGTVNPELVAEVALLLDANYRADLEKL